MTEEKRLGFVDKLVGVYNLLSQKDLVLELTSEVDYPEQAGRHLTPHQIRTGTLSPRQLADGYSAGFFIK